MRKDTLKVEIEYTPDYDSETLNQAIRNAIVDKVVKQYLASIDKQFKDKLDEMVTKQVSKDIKNIQTIPLDTCDLEKGAIKKSMTLRDYIIQRAIDSLKVRVDERGRSDSDSYNDKKTILEWTVARTIKDSKFSSALNSEIKNIEEQYKSSLKDMVIGTLAPVYEQLLLKLKS